MTVETGKCEAVSKVKTAVVGSEFQAAGPETAKLYRPYCDGQEQEILRLWRGHEQSSLCINLKLRMLFTLSVTPLTACCLERTVGLLKIMHLVTGDTLQYLPIM